MLDTLRSVIRQISYIILYHDAHIKHACILYMKPELDVAINTEWQ